MRELVQLPLRGGQTAVAERRPTEGSADVYFCGRGECPHWKGQPDLFPGAEAMVCELCGYEPNRICQPYYAELAEEIDRQRRIAWSLDDSLEFERRVQAAAGEGPA